MSVGQYLPIKDIITNTFYIKQMNYLPKLRSNTLFKKKNTRSYFTNYNDLRKAHKSIFKNQPYVHDKSRVSAMQNINFYLL